jgi:glycosyltransferase involved in cell wall biosynthesis
MKPAKLETSILVLGTQMEIAGSQRVMLSLARWFHNEGYPVQAIFYYDKQGLEATWQRDNNFHVTSLQARRIKSNPISNLFRLVRGQLRLFSILRKNIKSVIAFTPHSNLLGLPLAWIAGVPVRIGTHHGHIEGSSRLLSWLHGRLTNSSLCSMMVAVSSQVREHAVRREGASKSKIIVIENGIEPFAFKENSFESRRVIRSSLGLTEQDLLILTVGRLTIQKGHTYLLDAVKILSSKYPNTNFLFAGDGPLHEELQKKAENLGVSDSIQFLGVRNDVERLLLAADIFVQPSVWEGLSLALLEALMAGLPVIASRVEGVVDVVVDGESALLVPAKDPVALAEAIDKLIKEPEFRKQLAIQGQNRFLERYSVDRMSRSYEELILNQLANAS